MTTVGITGHRTLSDDAEWSWVREELDAALALLEPPIVGVSSLAEGADQCFADAVLAAGGRLHAVLAFEHFGESLGDDGRASFAALLDEADDVEVIDPQPTRDLAYLAAGLRVLELADVLFAVWDGKPAVRHRRHRGDRGAGDGDRHAGAADRHERRDGAVAVTAESTPVVVLLGAGGAVPSDPAAARKLGAAVVAAARTAGAVIVDGLGGAVGAAVAAACVEGPAVPVTQSSDPIGSATDLAGPHRVVVVLVGGDAATAQQLLDRRTRNWSIVGAPHSGGLAEQLSVGSRQRAAAEIVRGDELAQLQERRTLTVDRVARLQHIVVWELDEHEVVKQILARRKSYDVTAQQLQRHAHVLEGTVLGLGVFVTFLSLLNRELDASGAVHDVIHWTLVALPIIVAALIALVSVTGSGKRWLLVRAACEAIKREVFVWRTRTGVYAPEMFTDDETGPSDATELLVNRVAAIEAQLMGSAVVSSTAFAPVDDAYLGASDDDDGISRLTADDYLRVRVNDQLAYYRRKVTRLAPRLRRYQLAWIVAGAAGSILAAAGASLWIALTVAIVGAIGAHMKQVQLDTTLVGFNQGIARLQQCVTCWGAVPAERRTEARFALLVHDAEHALETEQASWVQQMKLGLDSLLPTDEVLKKTPATEPPPLDVELPTFDTPVAGPTPAPAPAPAPAPVPLRPRRRRATVGDEFRRRCGAVRRGRAR